MELNPSPNSELMYIDPTEILPGDLIYVAPKWLCVQQVVYGSTKVAIFTGQPELPTALELVDGTADDPDLGRPYQLPRANEYLVARKEGSGHA